MIMNQETEVTPTAFQQKVYAACSRIPEGKVSTYGSLAKSVGCGSAQAVGQALRVNPFAPQVPCHRVVKSDRSLGGFFGQSSGPEVKRKIRLLEKEGVKLDPSSRVLPAHMWNFT